MRHVLAPLLLIAACGNGPSTQPSSDGALVDGPIPVDAGGDAIIAPDAPFDAAVRSFEAAPSFDDAAAIDTADLKATFIEALCATRTTCCAQENVSVDPQRCRADLSMRPGFNPDAAQACMAELALRVARPSLWCQRLEVAGEHVCAQVFAPSPGTAAPGQRCVTEQDCARSALGQVVCEEVIGRDVPICQLLVRGKEGDGPCVDDLSGAPPPRLFTCDYYEDLYCDLDSKTCKRTLPVGAACKLSSGAWCGRGGYCESEQRLCAPRIPVGSPCCAAGCGEYCVSGAYCDRQTMLCAPLKPLGAACSAIECASGHCLDGRCASYGPDLATQCAQISGS